ncbi:MAG: DNA cytosine methyltransferase, partial [Acidobacteria bacterium]|nr:DNA cytosine methyltransferase [Acidobacteriota bacterium]
MDRTRKSGCENRFPLLSLFCGPGCLDKGFDQAWFNTELAIDIDEECVKTFKANFRKSVARKADISILKIIDLDNMIVHEIKPFGVIGGPPCQSFSVSNVFQKEDDPRHSLPENYALLLRKLNERNPI